MKKLAVIAQRNMFSDEQLTKLQFAGVTDFYEPTKDPQRAINKLTSGAEVLGFCLSTFPKHGWEYLGQVLKRNESITKLALDTTGLDEQSREITGQRGIMVMTLHDYLYRTKAEAAIEAILTTAHSALSQEVRGRKLGVIGEGQAGEEVTELGKKLGMSVSLWNPERTRLEGVKTVSKGEILSSSEYIVIAVTDTEENRELLGREQILQIHQGACVVNVGGRKVVNEQVIKEAVQKGLVAAYVYKPMPRTEEAQARRVAEFVKNVTGLAGRGSS